MQNQLKLLQGCDFPPRMHEMKNGFSGCINVFRERSLWAVPVRMHWELHSGLRNHSSSAVLTAMTSESRLI